MVGASKSWRRLRVTDKVVPYAGQQLRREHGMAAHQEEVVVAANDAALHQTADQLSDSGLR